MSVIIINPFLTNSILPSAITVSGAGTSIVNGEYVQLGTVADRPRYARGEYYIFYSVDLGYWGMFLHAAGSPLYKTANGDDNPFSTWYVGTGDAPAPTVTS